MSRRSSKATSETGESGPQAPNDGLLPALLDGLPLGVLLEDANQRVIYANQTLGQLFESSPSDSFIGLSIQAALRQLAGSLAEPDQARLLNTVDQSGSLNTLAGQHWQLTNGRILGITQNPLPAHAPAPGVIWQFREVGPAAAVVTESVTRDTPMILFALDAAGTVTSIEGRIPPARGEAETYIGRNVFDVLRQMAIDSLSEAVRRALAGEDIVATLETDNGEYDVRMSSVRAADGAIERVLGIIHNMSSRRKVERTLRRHNTYLETLHETTLDLVNRRDLDHLLQGIVERAASLLGTGNGYIFLIEPDEQHITVRYASGLFESYIGFRMARGEGAAGKVWASGEPLVIETYDSWEGRFPNFERNIIRALVCVPLRTSNHVVGVIGVSGRNEAHRFSAEEVRLLSQFGELASLALDNARLFQVSQTRLGELQDVYVQLQRLEQLKTQMIRVAAHDIRSPLGVISGYVTIMQEDMGERGEQYRPFFNSIFRAIERMEQMTADILSLERIHASNELNYERVSLTELAARAYTDHRDHALIKQLTYEYIAEKGEITVRGDPVQLYEAIANLISNAIKYTPSGRVVVRLSTAEQHARFQVEDTGFGIPLEAQAQLFEPFHRVKTEDTQSIDGTGLGLYLVKGIVDRHKGQMHFSSEPGRGSVFGFKLPLLPEEPANV